MILFKKNAMPIRRTRCFVTYIHCIWTACSLSEYRQQYSFGGVHLRHLRLAQVLRPSRHWHHLPSQPFPPRDQNPLRPRDPLLLPLCFWPLLPRGLLDAPDNYIKPIEKDEHLNI